MVKTNRKRFCERVKRSCIPGAKQNLANQILDDGKHLTLAQIFGKTAQILAVRLPCPAPRPAPRPRPRPLKRVPEQQGPFSLSYILLRKGGLRMNNHDS